MNFTDALNDIRDGLAQGEALEGLLADVSADYEIPVLALRNRADKAFGDLSTYAARTAATREIPPETARRLALGAVREKIQKLGQVAPGSAGEIKLRALIEEANALGGRFRVIEHGSRAPRAPDINALLAGLARMMRA